MKLLSKKVLRSMAIVVVMTTLFAVPSFSAGLLKPKDSGLPDLEIRDHKVKVVVENGYAITQVEQVFFNPTDKDLEAIYSFPVPESAAVSSFIMWIDGKPVTGEVLEKEEAKQVYEEQKANNKNAGLTSKNSYKTFEINVYPVLAGKETKIEIEYMQAIDIDTGIGRYVYPLEEGGVDEEAMAFWSTNDKVKGLFSFDMIIKSSYPINNIRLPAHPEAEIKTEGENWVIHIDNHMKKSSASGKPEEAALTINNEKKSNVNGQGNAAQEEVDNSFRLDRDVVVYYRLSENLPGSLDLVAYKTKDANRGTFMMTITPGIDLKPITNGQDWVFVIDASGSMQGKYATLAEGVCRSLKQMDTKDRFRIIVFNQNAKELTPGYVSVTQENVKNYCDVVSGIQPNNCTNLYAGLELGLKKADADRVTGIILVTDGVANVGITEQKKFIELVKKCDIRLFTFIMGNSSNMPLLKAMTDASGGTATCISNDDDIIGKIMLAQSKVAYEALHGVAVTISGVKVGDITPQKIGSLYRGEQLVLFGHYFGSGQAEVTMKTKISGEEKVYKTQFNFLDADTMNPEIERLWAYASIEHIQKEIDDFGETNDYKNSIIDLGKEYSLVTNYTSMVVVEEEVFTKLGIDRKNKQRTEIEKNARAKRLTSKTASSRVDTSNPMFSGSRPTVQGGAGAVDPISVMIFSPLLYGLVPKKAKQRIKDAFKK